MSLPVPILAAMVRSEWRLFRFALLFRDYVASRDHQACVQYHSRVVAKSTTTKYYLCNRLHRESGPAYIEKNRSGEVVCEKWYYGDQLHRSNGPAETKTQFNKKIQKWYCRGVKVNMIGGPQEVSITPEHFITRYPRHAQHVIRNSETGMIDFEEYEWFAENNRYYRDDGPSYYYRDEKSFAATWCNKMGYHRPQTGPHAGPAIESCNYYKYNIEDELFCGHMQWGIHERIWFENGLVHRLDGPAIETNGEYGDQWFVRGEPLMVRRPHCPGLD